MNRYWHLVFFFGILLVMISGGFIIGTAIKYIAAMTLANGLAIIFSFGVLLIVIVMWILSTYAGKQLEIFVGKRS